MGAIECLTIILAGGNGTRLGALTNHNAKPLVHFGGQYRIIDFTLSNCTHSGIFPLGILTQYQASEFQKYIGSGSNWTPDKGCGVHILPSRAGSPYTGTSNAVYQNLKFIEQYQPEHVLILPSDHIYKMNYKEMLDFHKKTDADVTISVTSVPPENASRFGIVNITDTVKITSFTEKPKKPKSSIASMGIYIFKWNQLKKHLIEDENNINSKHDFGKNIIPDFLNSGKKLYAFPFNGYWQDVGTIQSFWKANMDLLSNSFDLYSNEDKWEIFTKPDSSPSHFVLNEANIKNSIISTSSDIHGKVKNSVVCDRVTISPGAEISDCVIMPDAFIGDNVKIHKAVIGTGSWIIKEVVNDVDYRFSSKPGEALLI